VPAGGATGDTLQWNGTMWVAVSATPQPPSITSLLTATATVGAAFSYQIVATNLPTSYAANVPPPAGLSVNTSTGLISGTPTGPAGATNVTISATNAQGTGPTATLVITVNPAIPVVSPGTIVGTAGTAITPFQIVATNTPTSYAVTPPLPANLSLNTTTGQITGTPLAAGMGQTRTITAANVSGTSVAATLTLDIAAAPLAPVVIAGQSISSTEGTAISPFQIATTSGVPTSFAVSPALPNGLSLNLATGQITGTPAPGTAAGSPYTIGVTATNAAGTSPSVNLTILISAPSTGSAIADLSNSASPPAPPHGHGRAWVTSNNRTFEIWYDGGFGVEAFQQATGNGPAAMAASGAATAVSGNAGSEAILQEEPFPAGQEDGTIAIELNTTAAYFWDAVAGQWRPILSVPT